MHIKMTQNELQDALTKHLNDHVFGDEMPEVIVTSVSRSDQAVGNALHVELTIVERGEDGS